MAQVTRFDHHSTSVFAINANHQLSAQFLFATKYLYSQSPPDVVSQSHVHLFHAVGSFGTDVIHAALISVSIPDTSIHRLPVLAQPLLSHPGHLHLSH